MIRRLAILALASVALLSLPASAQAASPWWGLEAGSRPTNLQPAPDQSLVQEVLTEKAEYPFPLGTVLVSPIAVGGKAVGCLGVGEYFFRSADALCEEHTGFGATETPVELAELLGGLYEAKVQLAGPEGKGEAPAGFGEGALTILTPGRWAPLLELGPTAHEPNPFEAGEEKALGQASSEPLSEGSGRLVVTATNLGSAPLDATEAPLTIVDELPEGVQAYGVEAFAGVQSMAGPVDCAIEEVEEEEAETISRLECSFEGELPPYEAIEVELSVALTGEVPDGAAGAVSVSGGEGPDHSAAPAKSATQVLHVSGEAVRFGIEGFSMGVEEEGGGPVAQAGAHPYQLTQTLAFNSGPMRFTGSGKRIDAVVEQPGQPRNFRFRLPPGLVGNPSPIAECSFKQFTTQGAATPSLVNECPPESAVGAASVTVIESGSLGFARVAVPLFNLEPAYGEPARFGFMVVGVPVTIDTELRAGEAYAIGAKVLDASQVAQVLASTVSIWGNPGDRAHDSARGWSCLYFNKGGLPPCERPAGQSEAAFLRMPVSCGTPLSFGIEIEPWNAPPGVEVASATDGGAALSGCDLLPFEPEVESTPTTKLAANPSGLDFTLLMPSKGLTNPLGNSEAQPHRIEVTLPRGMTANPSVAEGLATCSEAELGRETAFSRPGEGCPEASKLGTVELETPLLAGRLLKGSVFLATPYENPSGSLIALYLTVREPNAGVLVTQLLEVRPDPSTGQLVTVAEEVPQLPFSALRLHLREGGRAPLISAPGCGTRQTEAAFYPYSISTPVIKSAPSEIVAGPDGGSCPTGAAPFDPGFEAGTANNRAGSYSPFGMRLTRSDGEQDMGKFSFVLPPGVVPKLAGVPYCPEAGIARARARQGPHGGQEEKDDPSCPAASRIGTTVAGAGVGNQLTYVEGKLYLAGPYNGDPISAVAITPAVAGPFDAGTVVVREALRLNPVTHVGEVDGEASDPIPHILKGIPLNLRDLRVYVDRPQFTLNATSCDPLEAGARIWGEGTALEPQGPSPVDLSSRYQAAGCRALGFKPRLGLKLKGGTKRGKFPALRATYVPKKKGQANLRRLALTFPSSEFIEQGHFRTICTRAQFKAGNGFGEKCPKRSIYGHVKAWSPLLDKPLKGPVYLRSSNHNLPDAVLALHGLIDIEVPVRIDSVRGRLRATVQGVPDAPVSRAVVRMQGGQKGLFVNSRNLCKKQKRNRARANLSAQSSRRRVLKPRMRALGCKKQAKRKRNRHRRR